MLDVRPWPGARGPVRMAFAMRLAALAVFTFTAWSIVSVLSPPA
jgi:hypothetical protein